MSRSLNEHLHYLTDQVRVEAFRQAINEVVKPGAIVLDLGAGTGIMSFLACQAGAKRVYAVDAGAMIEVARSLGLANRVADRVTYIKGHSQNIALPERVDVVVADQIGAWGFEAGLLEYFGDARERFLKPNGAMIPSQIDLMVAPVECREISDRLSLWAGSSAGFDLRTVSALAVNNEYSTKYLPENLLGPPALGKSFDLAESAREPFRLEADIITDRPGTLHGIGGWFEARLSEHVGLSNSPLAPKPISRDNIFLPLARPVLVTKGDRVLMTIHIAPTSLVISWRVEIWTGGAGKSKGTCRDRFAHSTWQGLLIAREDLQKSRPDFVPRLSPRGDARLTALSLCDGNLPLSEIEREVYRRHPHQFRSEAEAASFVSEVVLRDAAAPYDVL